MNAHTFGLTKQMQLIVKKKKKKICVNYLYILIELFCISFKKSKNNAINKIKSCLCNHIEDAKKIYINYTDCKINHVIIICLLAFKNLS